MAFLLIIRVVLEAIHKLCLYHDLKSVGLVLMVWMLVPRFKACYRGTLFDNRQ